MSTKVLMDTAPKDRKTVIIFGDIVTEKIIPSEVTELFIRGKKVNLFLSIIFNSAFHYGYLQHEGIALNYI